jgi:formylglycine-generating enzyme required for sulfatase activity
MMLNSTELQIHGETVELISVAAGFYLMGCPDEPDNFPLIRHSLSEFKMSKTAITRAVWASIMGTKPWAACENENDSTRIPATNVSQDDALEFCSRFSKIAGMSMTLPSDAQWEYACRAGTTTDYHWGNDYEMASDYAVFIPPECRGIEFAHPKPVMTKKSNPWGFYDLPGNVAEWVLDRFPFNPEGPYLKRDMFPEIPFDFVSKVGEMGVIRGSSFGHVSMSLTSYERNLRDPETRDRYTGFRIAICK